MTQCSCMDGTTIYCATNKHVLVFQLRTDVQSVIDSAACAVPPIIVLAHRAVLHPMVFYHQKKVDSFPGKLATITLELHCMGQRVRAAELQVKVTDCSLLL